MKNKLGGRIERVMIDHRERAGRLCVGHLAEGEVCFVDNGSDYIGRLCLARFDIDDKGSRKMGHFLTSNVPEDFQGLAKDAYVLVALWQERMGTKPIPTIKDVRRFYQPGDLYKMGFVKRDTTGNRGRYTVRKYSHRPAGESWNRMIKQLPHPGDQARLIVVEEGGRLEAVIESIQRAGLTPIQMETTKLL